MEVQIRKFPPLASDEPAHHGGDDQGPTPLEYVTAGLAACQTVTIAKIADAMRLSFADLAVEAQTEVGWEASRKGSGKIPRFTDCVLSIRLVTDETPGRIERLKELVEERCPASELFRLAGLAPKLSWQIVPTRA
jgi:putative redox protein